MEQTLGKRIMANRKKLGLTQDQLAEKLGVTAQAVSKWENDQSCPDISTLPKLADMFGISIDELLGRSPAQPVHETEFVEEEDDEKEPEGIHIQNGKWEFQWDGGKKSAVCFALFVLLVGCLTLLSRIMQWDVSLWEILWPSVLLVIGIQRLLHKFSFFAAGCTLFGVYFLLSNLGILGFTLGGELVFPIILVIFGISLLVDALRKKQGKGHVHINRKGSRKHTGDCTIDDDSFSCSTSFGEDHQYIQLPRLSRGNAEVSFGELTVDLSGVGALADGCAVHADCSFGELVIQVPRRYLVDPVTSTAFASINIKGQPDTTTEGTIRILADANFGEICIQYV